MKRRRLAELWRQRAESLRRYAPHVAAAIEDCAAELEREAIDDEHEPLTLRQAARESGYDEDWLGKLVKQGTIPNAGRPGAPRILRCHLPRKPGVSIREP